MKCAVVPLIAAGLLLLGGCASTSTPEPAAANKDESCRVTGSNLPRRECRGDVTVLPPSAIERLRTPPAGGATN